jgi:hypothetical protein
MVILSSLAGHAQQEHGSAGVDLPKNVRKALDDRWKGWQLATIDPQAVSCRPTNAAAPSVVVQGDLDGDGHPDTAFLIKTSQGVRLVAAITRVDDIELVEVDSLGNDSANGVLALEPRGAKFSYPDLAVDDFFPADTLTISRCGQPITAYFWLGLEFSKVELRSTGDAQGSPGISQDAGEIDRLSRPQARPEVADVFESRGRRPDRELARVEPALDLLPGHRR